MTKKPRIGDLKKKKKKISRRVHVCFDLAVINTFESLVVLNTGLIHSAGKREKMQARNCRF